MLRMDLKVTLSVTSATVVGATVVVVVAAVVVAVALVAAVVVAAVVVSFVETGLAVETYEGKSEINTNLFMLI